MAALLGLRQMLYLVVPNDVDLSNKTLDELEVAFAAATPFGVTAILLEIVYAICIRHRKTLYDMNDSICGGMAFFIQLISKSFIHLSEYGVYIAMHQRFAIVDLPDNIFSWVICAGMVDLLRYWSHRACHEVGFLWAIHKVHHSSEYYNFTTAFRVSFLQEYFSWALYCLLAFVVPPKMMLVHLALNNLYPFWLHTQTIPKLGIIEKFFITPSMHRVHHGRNEYCIDKNYGNFLRCWDDLFGTFAEERDNEPIGYGTCEPVNTFNGVFQQLNFVDVGKKLNSATTIVDKFKCFIMGPAWQPESVSQTADHEEKQTIIANGPLNHSEIPEEPEKCSMDVRFKSPNTISQSLYIAGQMAMIIIDLPLLLHMLKVDSINAWSLIYTAYVLYSFSTIGYLMDNWKCHYHQELVRQCFNITLLCATASVQSLATSGFRPIGQQLSLLLFLVQVSLNFLTSSDSRQLLLQRIEQMIVHAKVNKQS